jgi:hypothetical protein
MILFRCVSYWNGIFTLNLPLKHLLINTTVSVLNTSWIIMIISDFYAYNLRLDVTKTVHITSRGVFSRKGHVMFNGDNILGILFLMDAYRCELNISTINLQHITKMVQRLHSLILLSIFECTYQFTSIERKYSSKLQTNLNFTRTLSSVVRNSWNLYKKKRTSAPDSSIPMDYSFVWHNSHFVTILLFRNKQWS